MTRRTLVAASIAVAALGLGGCKTSPGATHAQPPGSTPAATPATPVTATSAAPADSAPANTTPATAGCLISPAEASAALGSDAGTANTTGGQCNYVTATGGVTIINTPYGAAAAQSFDRLRAATQPTPGFQDVTGVGDRAFLSDTLIVFLKGSNVVMIEVGTPTKPTAAAMTTLGHAAAGRL